MMDTSSQSVISENRFENLTRHFAIRNLHFAICNRRRPRAGFTLVELLVVITIIGILVALLSVAAAAAIKRGRQTAIKTELDQISVGIEQYKNDVAKSYPPNLQIDDIDKQSGNPANYDSNGASDTSIDEGQVLNNLRRHLKQAYPKHREPDELLRRLAGDTSLNGALPGGMTAGEALVFWLSGFSADPKYPISGEGGPSYQIDDIPSGVTEAAADPIESRKWIFPFEIARLEPRAADGYFDDSVNAGERFIEYTVTVNGDPQTRRINFWQYVPRNSTQPFLYFDTSRNSPTAPFDPPAATDLSNLDLHVHAIKKLSASAVASVPIEFVNPEKFQILHAGVDDEWGEEAFEEMTFENVPTADDMLLYPDGPFTGEVADTIVNFSDRTLEDSQP